MGRNSYQQHIWAQQMHCTSLALMRGQARRRFLPFIAVDTVPLILLDLDPKLHILMTVAAFHARRSVQTPNDPHPSGGR